MGGHLKKIDAAAAKLASLIDELPLDQKVLALNVARARLHAVSPFSNHPVDCVAWVPGGDVVANDYNPNSVAPPEMKLLSTSIRADGYTQPIVTNEEDGARVVVDGFHRHRVGREDPRVSQSVHGYLPTVQIRGEQTGREQRQASTIRHNRARGTHSVEKMSEIVAELSKKGWDDQKIGSELGMEPDEVLRLKQITGLADLFKDRAFSEAWEADTDEPIDTPDD